MVASFTTVAHNTVCDHRKFEFTHVTILKCYEFAWFTECELVRWH
jgi:hypothetical protein